VCHQDTSVPPSLSSARRSIEHAGTDGVPFVVVDPGAQPARQWAVIATDIYGVTPFYEHLGALLAGGGYRVAIPDLFHRLGPASDSSRDAALARRAKLDDQRALADLEQVIGALATRGQGGTPEPFGTAGPGGSRYAMVGFCLGGSLALLTAAAHPEQATVTYYAFPRGAPNPLVAAPDPIDVAASIQGPVLGFWGRDDYIDAAEVDLLTRELARSGRPQRTVWYDGAGHSFLSGLTEPGPSSAAAADSWQSTMTFLAEHVPVR
jgi:carboxymethylenebutenolidase